MTRKRLLPVTGEKERERAARGVAQAAGDQRGGKAVDSYIAISKWRTLTLAPLMPSMRRGR